MFLWPQLRQMVKVGAVVKSTNETERKILEKCKTNVETVIMARFLIITCLQ